jgi:hypothetical protein
VVGPSGEDLDSLFLSDGTAVNLSAGAAHSYLAQNDAFGTDPGTYELVAWYQSTRGEWFPVPPGDAGTATAITLDAS